MKFKDFGTEDFRNYITIQNSMSNLKVALVHDFLKEYGGAERVVETLHQMWPEAPVHTSFVDWDGLGVHAERIRKWQIVQSPFGKTWFMRKLHSPLRFLAPYVWESFDFSGFDVVISSSGWYISRGILTRPETMHICYLHHPPRHLYGYQTAMEWQKYWPIRWYGTVINHFLRRYDFLTAQRVDYFIANSEETKRRIEKFYRRDAEVIYPPVQMQKENSKFKIQNSKFKNYFLIVSRLARAKHIDLAIEVCQKLENKLVVVGKGRDEVLLKQLANQKPGYVEFYGEVPDEELPHLYQNARALLFPSEDEEFGIVPVEAMGYGIPVIAYRSGGLPETIIEGKTGVFFDQLKLSSIEKAINRFEKTSFSKEAIRKQAERFSKEVFVTSMRSFVQRTWEQYKARY